MTQELLTENESEEIWGEVDMTKISILLDGDEIASKILKKGERFTAEVLSDGGFDTEVIAYFLEK